LEIWRITVQGQPRQKALKTLISFNKIWVWWLLPVITATRKK
jgi:hypothetical protein